MVSAGLRGDKALCRPATATAAGQTRRDYCGLEVVDGWVDCEPDDWPAGDDD